MIKTMLWTPPHHLTLLLWLALASLEIPPSAASSIATRLSGLPSRVASRSPLPPSELPPSSMARAPHWEPRCLPFRNGVLEDVGLMVVNQCPPDFNETTTASTSNTTSSSSSSSSLASLQRLCEDSDQARAQGGSLYSILPVTSSSSLIHYANYFCAACHGVADLVYWRLVAPQLSPNEFKRFEKAPEEFVLDRPVWRLPAFLFDGENKTSSPHFESFMQNLCYRVYPNYLTDPKTMDCIANILKDPEMPLKNWTKCFVGTRIPDGGERLPNSLFQTVFDLTLIVSP